MRWQPAGTRLSTPTTDWCEPLPDGRQRWGEDAIDQLLAAEDAEVLFVAGCEENQVRFLPRFDLIILLSALAEVLVERLASRTKQFLRQVTPRVGARPGGSACGRAATAQSGRS